MLAYVHIPFCDSKCHYCAFNSYTHLHAHRKAYMKALQTQIEHDLNHYHVTPRSIETLFLGGGTPSTVDAALYAPIFELLAPFLAPDAEITTEANPNSATRAWLSDMKALGVNRVSFGVQSFNPEKLAWLNRAHSARQASQAVLDAYDVGLKNLSLDLIYGTRQDTKALLEADIAAAFALPINHLSAYALTIEAHTPFDATPHVAHEDEALTAWLFDAIQKQGFTQYEISNFGTYQSRHNLGYWQYKNYLGWGAGAVGCIDGVRYYPASDIAAYVADPLARTLETLTALDIKSEKVLLGMRSQVGCDVSLFSPTEQERIAHLLDAGTIYQKNAMIFNPNYLLADEIALYILDA